MTNTARHPVFGRYALALAGALLLVWTTTALAASPAPAAEETQVMQATELGGCWQGSWSSCESGHRGPLSATFRRVDATRYCVNFSGKFLRFVPFQYTVTLRIVSDDGQTVQLAGSSYLGRLFGTFHYRATATAGRFVAHYSSCDDRGQFVLCRVGY